MSPKLHNPLLQQKSFIFSCYFKYCWWKSPMLILPFAWIKDINDFYICLTFLMWRKTYLSWSTIWMHLVKFVCLTRRILILMDFWTMISLTILLLALEVWIFLHEISTSPARAWRKSAKSMKTFILYPTCWLILYSIFLLTKFYLVLIIDQIISILLSLSLVLC